MSCLTTPGLSKDIRRQLLRNLATKDMVWKYLLCTSLQDVQKMCLVHKKVNG